MLREILDRVVELEEKFKNSQSIGIFDLTLTEYFGIMISVALFAGALVPIYMTFMQARASDRQRADIRNEFNDRIDEKVKTAVREIVADSVQNTISSELARNFQHETRKYVSSLYLINYIIAEYNLKGKFKSGDQRHKIVSELSLILYQILGDKEADLSDALFKLWEKNFEGREGFPKYGLLQLLFHMNQTGFVKGDAVSVAENIATRCGGSVFKP